MQEIRRINFVTQGYCPGKNIIESGVIIQAD